MAYYLYKKIRSKRSDRLEANENVTHSNRNEAPVNGGDPIPKNDRNGIMLALGSVSEDPETSALRVQVEKSEKKRMTRYRWRIIIGLFFPVVVQALSTTTVAAALPFIGSDFHQLSQLNWIISAYNLTSASFIPAWGQFADVFGRYVTLQAAIVAMIIGSTLCAAAPVTAFPMLLVGRGLEGVGSAGILILSKIVLADKVSLKENAKNNTIFTFVIGVGYGVGPVVGGYLTSVSWRWIFIINLPLCVVGVILMHFVTRPALLGPQAISGISEHEKLSSSETFTKRLVTVDFGGQFLFLFGVGLVVLALTWAGSYYPWKSAQIIACLSVGVTLVVVFFVWESMLLPGQRIAINYPHQQAMLPLKMLWTRNAGILMYINFVTGMAMYAVFYFVDLYFTIVQQFDSGKSGTNLLYYIPGLGAGAYMAIFACNVWPRKTWYPLSFGTIVEAVGITLLAAALNWGHLPTVYGMLALTGVGTGVRFMPGTLHGVGFYRKNIASTISLMSLSVSLGGVFASTIMLNIFNNKMENAGISFVHGESSASSFSQIAKLSTSEQLYLRSHAKNSIVIAFYAISSFMWLGVLAALFLGNVTIKKHLKEADTYEDGETEVGSLSKGAYISSCFRRCH